MDFKQLSYFLRICDEQSLSKASETLFISQQGLSASIKRLESQLGCTLLERHEKGVSLTPAGEYFQAQAQKLLALYDETLQGLSAWSEKQQTVLSVSASYGVMVRLSPWIPVKFQQAYPKIQMSIREQPDVLCEQAVERQECEVGFTSHSVDTERFEGQFIFTEPLIAVAHRDHPLAKRETISFLDLRDEPIYMMNATFHTNNKFYEHCRKAGFEPTIGYETMEMGVVFQAVHNNQGIGILNRHLARVMQTETIRILAVDDPDFSWNVYMIWKKTRHLSSMAEAFLKYLVNALG